MAWRALPGGELVAERQLPKDLVATAAFSPDAGTLPLEPPPEPAPPPSPVLAAGAGVGSGDRHLPRALSRVAEQEGRSWCCL